MRRNVYLDYSASTPVDPRVLETMLPYFSEVYGNATSIHSYGRQAEQAIEDARETVARVLNCQPGEIIFTSGGSEGDNLAIRGAAWRARQRGQGAHLITMPLEHSAVSQTITQLGGVMGFEYSVLPVDRYGQVDPAVFAASCGPETTLASIMYANNEVGTLEPVAELATIAREHGVLFHTDAVQAAGQVDLDVQKLGVDLLSISAHKFYGPKGVGALYCRHGVELIPSQSGGSHESGRRAGTHNTPFIVGLAKALELAYDEYDAHTAHYTAMRDRLIERVLAQVPQAQLTGHPENRLASHASFLFDGLDTNALLMHLDLRGVAASGGSACKVGNPEPSAVLLALGYNEREALGGLRLTVGRQTTAEDIDYAVEVLAEVVARLYGLGVRS